MKVALGKKLGDMLVGSVAGPEDEHFPTLHIDDAESMHLEHLPNKGKAEISFKVTSRHTHERDEDGKKTKSMSLTLEVHSIEVEIRKRHPRGNDDARQAVREAPEFEDEEE